MAGARRARGMNCQTRGERARGRARRSPGEVERREGGRGGKGAAAGRRPGTKPTVGCARRAAGMRRGRHRDAAGPDARAARPDRPCPLAGSRPAHDVDRTTARPPHGAHCASWHAPVKLPSRTPPRPPHWPAIVGPRHRRPRHRRPRHRRPRHRIARSPRRRPRSGDLAGARARRTPSHLAWRRRARPDILSRLGIVKVGYRSTPSGYRARRRTCRRRPARPPAAHRCPPSPSRCSPS